MLSQDIFVASSYKNRKVILIFLSARHNIIAKVLCQFKDSTSQPKTQQIKETDLDKHCRMRNFPFYLVQRSDIRGDANRWMPDPTFLYILAVRQDNRGSRINGYLDCQLKRIRFYPPVRADGTVQGLIRSAAISEAAHRLRSDDNVLHTRLRFIITDSGKCPVKSSHHTAEHWMATGCLSFPSLP